MRYENTIQSTIEAAAAAKFGAAAVSICRQLVKYRPDGLDGGEWFVLSIDRGDGWEVLGRRRTRQELLQLVSR